MRTMLSQGKGRIWVGSALVVALGAGVVLGSIFAGRSAAAAQTPGLNFSGSVGILVHNVNASNTADYERFMSAYSETLTTSDSAERQQMGNGFTLYRAAEAGAGGAAIYVSVFDPVVSGADYQHITVLAQDFGEGPPGNGDEVRDLYGAFTGAVAPGSFALNLSPVN